MDGVYVLGRILHLEGGRLAGAGSRSAPAGGLNTVNLLQAAGGAGLGEQLEPRHGGLAPEALGGVGGRGRAGVLAAGDLAQLPGARDVQVEEGRGAVQEEVLAADEQVGGCELLDRRRDLRQVEVQGGLDEGGGEVGAGCYEAGRVEEGCHGTDCLGGFSGGARVARVVLCAAADGDVLEGQALVGLWEVGSA